MKSLLVYTTRDLPPPTIVLTRVLLLRAQKNCPSNGRVEKVGLVALNVGRHSCGLYVRSSPQRVASFAVNQVPALAPTMQNPFPNGSLQNAIGGRGPPSNFCSHLAPPSNTFATTPSKSSTWKSM